MECPRDGESRVRTDHEHLRVPKNHGIGPDTAALLLIAAGDHPVRLRSEAAWAYLCAAAPIPASSGKVTAFGGNELVAGRQATQAFTRGFVLRRLRRAWRHLTSVASLRLGPDSQPGNGLRMRIFRVSGVLVSR
jgi:hypothetical protein